MDLVNVRIVALKVVILISNDSPNETTTLHSPVCTWIAIANYNDNDHQFNQADRLAIIFVFC